MLLIKSVYIFGWHKGCYLHIGDQMSITAGMSNIFLRISGCLIFWGLSFSLKTTFTNPFLKKWLWINSSRLNHLQIRRVSLFLPHRDSKKRRLSFRWSYAFFCRWSLCSKQIFTTFRLQKRTITFAGNSDLGLYRRWHADISFGPISRPIRPRISITFLWRSFWLTELGIPLITRLSLLEYCSHSIRRASKSWSFFFKFVLQGLEINDGIGYFWWRVEAFH